METRLTLRPGQGGTKKLLERYGERLVCARYLYDDKAGRRLDARASATPYQSSPLARAGGCGR